VPVQGAFYNWKWGSAGDSGASGSLQMNFRPIDALALTSLSLVAGGGLVGSGFSQYRSRNPDGSDQDHNFAWDSTSGLPPIVRDSAMTSVTAELDLGGHQQGVMTVLVWYL